MKFSLSGVSPCQDDPVEIILLTIGPSVSEFNSNVIRVFLSEVSPCQDDPVEILPLAM